MYDHVRMHIIPKFYQPDGLTYAVKAELRHEIRETALALVVPPERRAEALRLNGQYHAIELVKARCDEAQVHRTGRKLEASEVAGFYRAASASFRAAKNSPAFAREAVTFERIAQKFDGQAREAERLGRQFDEWMLPEADQKMMANFQTVAKEVLMDFLGPELAGRYGELCGPAMRAGGCGAVLHGIYSGH